MLSFEPLILLRVYLQTVADVDAIMTPGQFVSLRFKWIGEVYDYRLCCEFKASTFVILRLPLPL